jgi:hypothetical protein
VCRLHSHLELQPPEGCKSRYWQAKNLVEEIKVPPFRRMWDPPCVQLPAAATTLALLEARTNGKFPADTRSVYLAYVSLPASSALAIGA